jgi:hypothetical protein
MGALLHRANTVHTGDSRYNETRNSEFHVTKNVLMGTLDTKNLLRFIANGSTQPNGFFSMAVVSS